MLGSDIMRLMVRKKKRKQNPGQVIIPAGHPNPPEPHEVDAAMVLANHYQSIVEFLVPIDDYKRKTADIFLLGVEWELKCPFGASKATIENQFRRASRQARNIVVDTRQTKLDYKTIEKKVLFELKERPSMKKVSKVTLINKHGIIVEIKK